MEFEITTHILIPLLIMAARITDVSIGTLRIFFIAKGHKIIAPALGFFEILIWILALAQIMQNLNNPLTYLAYALGFALGTYVGLYIEDNLAVGTFMIQVITKRPATRLIRELKQKKYKLTNVQAQGNNGKANILYIIVKRKDFDKVVKTIKKFNPKATFMVEDVRHIQEIAQYTNVKEPMLRKAHRRFKEKNKKSK